MEEFRHNRTECCVIVFEKSTSWLSLVVKFAKISPAGKSVKFHFTKKNWKVKYLFNNTIKLVFCFLKEQVVTFI